MNALQELIDIIEIAERSQGPPYGVVHRRIQRAKYAVDEIKRLRAKTNRLIRVANAEDADGNYVAHPNAQPDDLILEEEI